MDDKVFLTAEWRYLAMFNYEIEPKTLARYVPAGTELDQWNGKTFASIVGFLFLNTRVLGLAVPFHRNFEELNLRFYVRHKRPEGWVRGVVFIKEIVPLWAVANVAKVFYGERYVAMPMRHKLDMDRSRQQESGRVEYAWRSTSGWNQLRLQTVGPPCPSMPGSEEEFITEHYWGYAVQRGKGTIEYRVEHTAWRVWQVSEANLNCNVRELYGPEFVDSLSARPSSAFLAEGSPVTVYRGSRLRR